MNLIIKNEPFKRPSLFEKIPLVDPGFAKVYRGKNDFYIVDTEKDPLTKGELMTKGIYEYFDIDLKEFSLNGITEEFRDKNKYYKFNVEINIKVKVSNPIAIVRNNINNPYEIISDKLNFLLKRTASSYTVEERESFAEELYKNNSYYKRLVNEEIEKYGLDVRSIFMEVLLSKESIEKIEEENQKTKENKMIAREYELKKLKDKKEEEIIQEKLKKINEFKANNDMEGLQIWASHNRELMDNLNIAIENSYKYNKRVREDYLGYLKTFREMDINIDMSSKSLIDIVMNNNTNTIELNNDDSYKLNRASRESIIEKLEDD